MGRNRTTYVITTPDGTPLNAEFRWTVSRGRDTYGYNIVTLRINGDKVASYNGGGYDMEGSCLGDWLAQHAAKELLAITVEFYGLSFHDPNYDAGKAELPSGKTVAEAEAAGESLGLDRYQQFRAASSKIPSTNHIAPMIDGGCGMRSVIAIGEAIGYKFAYVS